MTNLVTETAQSVLFTKQDLTIVLIGLLGTLILGSLAAFTTFIKGYTAATNGTKRVAGMARSLSYTVDGFWLIWVIGSILLVYGQAHGWVSW